MFYPPYINGQANPYIYSRIYCSQAITNAQLFWYKDKYYSTNFNLNQGWNVVQLSNLPDWINSTTISQLRLDFGNASGVNVKVDWITISPQAYSDSLVSVVELKNGVATLATSCTGAVGTYTVTTNIGGIINSTVVTVTNVQAITNTQSPFTAGNLVVARIGDGATATITGNSTYFPVALQEYTTAGVLVQTIPIASASSGSQLTITGNNQEVSLNLSADKAYVSLLGYDASPTNNSTATSSFSKVVGRVGVNGVVDYSTKIPADNAILRQVTSVDGSNFWYAGSTSGISYLPYANSSNTAVTNISSNGATNVKAIDIFNGQLYGMGFNSAAPSLYSVGTGLTTTTTTNALLAGLPTGSSGTNNGFVFFDTNGDSTPDLLYTIDGTNLRKYTYSATAVNYISGFTLTAAGSGYTSTPTVSFSGGGGSGLVATATVASNVVTGIYSTVSGFGYTSAPTVSFSGGGGSGAAATATITTAPGWVYNGSTGIGAVSAINVTGGGSGYTSAPTVSISGGNGSGAAATVTISGGAVIGVTITNCGSGYTGSPTITFNNTGTGGSGATATASLPGTLAVGITGTLVSNKAQLYITLVQTAGTTSISSNGLLSISDSNGAGAAPAITATILATAGSNYIYRGVAFAPNPSFATWTGTTNTNWNTGTNWLSGTVPGNSVSINIPPVASGNYPVLPSALTTKGITVQFGARLSTNTATAVTGNITVSSGGTFTIGNATTVTGSITNSGTTTINAATTITGAFTASASSITSMNANTTVNGNVIFPNTSTIAIASGMALTTQGNVGATIAGDGTNAGTFTGSGKVVMNSSAITTFGCSFNNVDLNTSSTGYTISGTPTINGFLNLITGQLNGGAATLTFGNNASAQVGPKSTIGTLSGTIAFNGRPVTFKSDATGTAKLGIGVAGSISGATNITVERYITAKTARKFSYIGSPVTASIRNSWQKQIYVSGYGAGGLVCGNTSGDGGSTDKYNSNGFDATLYNTPTIYKYNATLVNGSRWVGIANTEQTNLSPGTGYAVNIRGNRNSATVTCTNQLATGSPTPPEAVTLSATGTITTGDLIVALNDPSVNRFTLLANPYPSQISFSAFRSDNSNIINNNLWTYSPFGNNNYTTYSNGVIANAATGYDNTSGDYIASGQAFFVKANTAGSVTFHEAHKASGSIPNNQYFGNAVDPLIRVGLRSTTDNSLLDEIVVRYNSNGSSSYLPNWDANSLSNGSQTLVSFKGTERLAIATHAEVNIVDTTNLAVKSSTVGTYRLSFSDYQDLDNTQTITLVDKFLNTKQDVRANQVYDFNVTSDSASEGSNRFKVLIGDPSALPVNFTAITATRVGDVVNVKWRIANEALIASYNVERSTNDTSFNTINTKKAAGANSYTAEDTSIPSNTNTLYYRIKAIGSDGATKYSSVANLTTYDLRLTALTIYPNPVKNKIYVILKNEANAIYDMKIITITGKEVYARMGTAVTSGKFILDASSFASGIYMLELSDHKGNMQHQKFVKV